MYEYSFSSHMSDIGGAGGGAGGGDEKKVSKKRKSEIEDLLGKLDKISGADKDAELEWYAGHKNTESLPGHTKCCICMDTDIRNLEQMLLEMIIPFEIAAMMSKE
jgi:hypothetical protein